MPTSVSVTSLWVVHSPSLAILPQTVERCAAPKGVKLDGEEDEKTLNAANNYARSLLDLRRFEEVRSLLRKTIPIARRVLGESHEFTLVIRSNYAAALYKDDGATLDDLFEAITTLEDTGQIARRVFGGAHPITTGVECWLRRARAALRARETGSAT